MGLSERFCDEYVVADAYSDCYEQISRIAASELHRHTGEFRQYRGNRT